MQSKLENCNDQFVSVMPDIVYDQNDGERMAARIEEVKDMWFQLVGNTTEPDVFGNVLMADIDFNAIDKFIKNEL